MFFRRKKIILGGNDGYIKCNYTNIKCPDCPHCCNYEYCDDCDDCDHCICGYCDYCDNSEDCERCEICKSCKDCKSCDHSMCMYLDFCNRLMIKEGQDKNSLRRRKRSIFTFPVCEKEYDRIKYMHMKANYNSKNAFNDCSIGGI